MDKDKRISKRRSMHYTAVLAHGPSEFQRCRLSDVSATGARIEVEGAEKLPDRFVLFLSNNGSARRICRVIWRKPHQIGVKFETRHAQADCATLVPKMDDTAAAESDPAEIAPSASEPAESAEAD
jgi:PilZ domain